MANDIGTETNIFISVVITVFAGDQVFLPRAMTCLMNQTLRDFELIVVVDGESPLEPYEPKRICNQTVPGTVIYRPRSNTIGFRERHHGMSLARGKYITWLNVDNLIYPHWLQCHFENAHPTNGAISIINTHYWRGPVFRGVYPRALAHGHIDLLNYALPLDLAKRLKVFGPDEEHIPHADWVAFERCAREASIVWRRDQPICACHY